ncbi:MAG: hypothetical protein RSA57_03850 [Cetobacterium sp.]|uniref:hypothetical protein n=1 Tax=Bacteria TaxID=2 RepID=UPI002FC65FE4
MIDKDDFLREAKEYTNDVEEKLVKLYERNENIIYSKENDLETYSLINNIIADLFNPTGVFSEPMIPLSFLETSIGRVIISALSDIDNRMYSINDLINMTRTAERIEGYSYQYLSQEIKAGRLKASKDNNRWTIPHAEVKRYLKTKGIE